MKRLTIVVMITVFAATLLLAGSKVNAETVKETDAAAKVATKSTKTSAEAKTMADKAVAKPTQAPKKAMSKYSKKYAEELLNSVDDSMYPKLYKSTLDMNTYRKGRKTLKFTYEIYSKSGGKDGSKALMEITKPARDKGKKILMTDNNLWMYMPNVSRPIKLSRKQAFMGSTFSNEDLSDSTWSDDYDAEVTDEKKGNLELTMTAKRNDVAYAKIIMWVDKAKRVPVEGTYYGLSGKAIKKLYFSNLQEVAGLLRPLDMKMEDLLEEGAYTEVKTTELKELKSIPSYKFDQTQLGR